MAWEGGSWRDWAIFMKRKKPGNSFWLLSKHSRKFLGVQCRAYFVMIHYERCTFRNTVSHMDWGHKLFLLVPDSEFGIKRHNLVCKCYHLISGPKLLSLHHAMLHHMDLPGHISLTMGLFTSCSMMWSSSVEIQSWFSGWLLIEECGGRTASFLMWERALAPVRTCRISFEIQNGSCSYDTLRGHRSYEGLVCLFWWSLYSNVRVFLTT